ncbi:MAG: Flp pilus assembly protein CpaB [Alphaproteobacteria bacterium]|nr:Flp pilus assembly protein CpaB [Alphaproteobacteria bacterium]
MRFGGLIFAIILAAVAAFIVLSMSGGNSSQVAQTPGQAPQQSVSTTNVIVAAQPIVPGMLIKDEMLEVQPWPEHLVVEGFAIAGNDVVSGMVSRGNFQPQEPILTNKLVNKDDPNFIAGTLPKGMRMVTIQTNETDGLAGFVFPGDRVDVMLTHEIEEEKWVQPPGGAKGQLSQKRETKSLTETLLTNVRVLAVDQRAAGGVKEDGTIPIPRSVSLAASPTDAQRLRLGAKVGALTLTLRSTQDEESVDPMMVTAFNDISQYQKPDESVTPTSGIIIVRGTQPEESTGPSAPLDLTAQIASSALAPGASGAAQVVPAVAVRVNPGEPSAN